MEPLKQWFDVTATEIRAVVISLLTALAGGVAFIVSWAFRLESRVSALEDAQKQIATHNTEDHQRIETKLDQLIVHLIENKR